MIDIPPSFSRPVHIGVYGHPNYPHSTYTLEGVIVEEEEYDPFAQASYNDEEYSENEEDNSEKTHKSKRQSEEGFDDYFKENSPLRIILTILGSILEILLEVLI